MNALQVPFLLTDNSVFLKELLHKEAIPGLERGPGIQKTWVSLLCMAFSSCVICTGTEALLNQFLRL